MPYEIEIVPEAVEELAAIPIHVRRVVADAIERRLVHQPELATRNRKPLPGVTPGFEHVPPIWELRVGDYRVFYDVDYESDLVVVRAIRRKSPKRRTEDIL